MPLHLKAGFDRSYSNYIDAGFKVLTPMITK